MTNEVNVVDEIDEILYNYTINNIITQNDAKIISTYLKEISKKNNYLEQFLKLCKDRHIEEYTADLFIDLRRHTCFRRCNNSIKAEMAKKKTKYGFMLD